VRDFRGGFQLSGIGPDAINGENGAAVPYRAAFIVPPHRPPAIVRQSGLAAPSGWVNVTFPNCATRTAHGCSVPVT